MKEEYHQTQFTTTLGDLTLPAVFYIVTAHNPFGSTVSDEENQKMNDALLEKINQASWQSFPVTGQCEDHAEAGFGVVATRAEAIDLGRNFRQDAIYEVRDDLVILVDCKGEEEDVSIGHWSQLQAPTS